MARLVGLTVLAALLAGGSAHATPITLDGSWWVVDDLDMVPGAYFTGLGLGSNTFAGATSWDWISSSPVHFTITDYFVPGDQYNIYDNGSLFATVLGGTEWHLIPDCDLHPFDSSCHWNGDHAAAFADPVFANGQFLFRPGAHSLVIQSIGIPVEDLDTGALFPDATVAFSATPVPEPASLLLVGTGALALGARLRSRSRRSR